MDKKLFKVIYRSKRSKARLGEIHTTHGVIKTPAFVPCATRGTLKTIIPSSIKDIGIQTVFVNTYHLVSHPGVDIIAKGGGIHKWSGLDIPLMSDSGGFQVFSLAKQRENHKSQITNNKSNSNEKLQNTKKANIRGEEQPLVINISEDGVKFRSLYDGQMIEFTPEKSIEYQMKIGADIMMAFDECTSYPVEHRYAKKAMERTHEWLVRCVEHIKAQCHVFYSSGRAHPDYNVGTPHLPSRKKMALSLLNNNQYIYGIIHGSTFEDLRKKSAEFVVSQDTDGVAIGGVAVGEGKKLIRDQVKWVADYLPSDRPVHLLGVGQFDDILDLVGYGIDTFDCVEPTRLARMGRLYQLWRGLPRACPSLAHQLIRSTRRGSPSLATRHSICPNGEVDIFKSKYKYDLSPVDENCECYVCCNFTKSYLHHLFKQREILGYSLATYHNLWVMERFFEEIRKLISSELL